MKNLKLLWDMMKGSRVLYIAAMISMGMATLLALINPLIIRVTIDSIIGSQPMEVPLWVRSLMNGIGGRSYLAQRLWIIALALVLITMINGVFLYAKGKWSAVAGENIARNMREQLYDHIQNQPYSWHVGADTGDLIQRCTSDVETIRRFLTIQATEASRAIFTLGFTLWIMLSLDVTMTLISMAVVPFIFVFSVYFYIKVRDAFQLADESEARLTTILQENLAGVRIVRAFGRQAFERDKFAAGSREYQQLVYKIILYLAWFWSFSDFFSLLQIGGVLVAGTYFAAIGKISLGTLIVFTTYEGMLLWPIRQLGRILSDMGKSVVALGRIREILESPREDMVAQGLEPKIKGEIQFEKVHFSYDDGYPILRDLSFHIRPGQTIAVLGPTGSGKSSLVHLLQGLYDYQGGRITIDGMELRRFNKRHLRKNIGIVLQEPFLFSKTLEENIALAKKGIKKYEIIKAARAASIHHVIQSFDKGYETPVGERGVTLSGGQKQRIAIARSLVQEAPILIFDDSLSAVDTETDATIRNALRERNKNTTTIIISHRITTVAEADVILVLDQGRMVQWGSHQELMEQEGIYQRIWRIQNQLEEELEKEIQEQ